MFHVVEICPCSPEVCFCPLLFGPTLAAHLQSKHPSCKTWPICTYPWTMEQRMVDGWKDWLDQILVTSAIITCHNALLLFIIFVPFPRLQWLQRQQSPWISCLRRIHLLWSFSALHPPKFATDKPPPQCPIS